MKELADEPHLELLAVPSELQVLLELGELESFRKRWLALRGQCADQPVFWLQGGYAASMEIEERADAAEEARKCFLAGAEIARDPEVRGALEAALLQLDWMTSPAVVSFDPLSSGDEYSAERKRLRELAARAEAAATAAAAIPTGRTVAADALLVAAQATRATGDLARGWQLLERACREFREEAPWAQYTCLVGYRVAESQLNEPGFVDLDADCGGDLSVAAARGLEFAVRVLDLPSSGASVHPQVIMQARVGALLCALQIGEASVALPLALQLRREGADESVSKIGDLAIEWGGVRLDRLEGPVEHRLRQLSTAVATATAMLDQGLLEAAEIRTMITRWRSALPAMVASEGAIEARKLEEQFAELIARTEAVDRKNRPR